MKTAELIKKANREIKNIKTVLEEEHICFYEYDQEKPFYKYPTWGKTRGSGTAKFTYLNGDTIDSIYMLHIFKLLDLLDEYIETDLEDRKEEKKYWVILPMGQNQNKYMYKESVGSGVDFFRFYERSALEKSDCNRFTVKEIEEIDKKYMAFAEEAY